MNQKDIETMAKNAGWNIKNGKMETFNMAGNDISGIVKPSKEKHTKIRNLKEGTRMTKNKKDTNENRHTTELIDSGIVGRRSSTGKSLIIRIPNTETGLKEDLIISIPHSSMWGYLEDVIDTIQTYTVKRKQNKDIEPGVTE